MTTSVLKMRGGLLWSLLVVLVGFMATGCSKDEDDDFDSKNPFVGAWLYDEDDETWLILYVDEGDKYGGVVIAYETTPELYYRGYYTERYSGTYDLINEGTMIQYFLDDDEYDFLEIKGKGKNAYLQFPGGGFQFHRIETTDVPTRKSYATSPEPTPTPDPEPTPTPTPSTPSDELAGTTWKVTRMSGWGADGIYEYRGMELRFKNGGKVTEWYSYSDNNDGTYSISGNILTLDGLAMVNEWGPTYYFSISSDEMTLVSSKGSSLETKFYLTRQ